MKPNTIVFDFDGTICFLFKNIDLEPTKRSLQEALKSMGIHFPLEHDAFDVFGDISSQVFDSGERLRALRLANEILTAAEVNAVDGCVPIFGAEEIIGTLYRDGFAIGIASNNSGECIRKFMDSRIPDVPFCITGRDGLKPYLMKPNAWSLTTTIARLGSDERHTVFIGDTQRDYSCAQEINCRFIGMAADERKRKKLLNIISENDVVGDFFELKTRIMEL